MNARYLVPILQDTTYSSNLHHILTPVVSKHGGLLLLIQISEHGLLAAHLLALGLLECAVGGRHLDFSAVLGLAVSALLILEQHVICTRTIKRGI
ncbi:MAG TPA: hypothetical protein VLQ48_04010 [Chloroflexia bacterium]|nr:hypothetical protein [Chloroflexia bacterium]